MEEIKEVVYEKLPEEFKKEWIEALRSGKYEQGTGQLRRLGADGKYYYCCLGVACEVLNVVPKDDACLIGSQSIQEGIDLIPEVLCGTGLQNTVVRKLVAMNDTQMYPFNTIADWIEENL